MTGVERHPGQKPGDWTRECAVAHGVCIARRVREMADLLVLHMGMSGDEAEALANKLGDENVKAFLDMARAAGDSVGEVIKTRFDEFMKCVDSCGPGQVVSFTPDVAR